MDFLREKTEVLPIKILPSFRLLISSKSGKLSGSVHDSIMNRWNNGEAKLKSAMDSYELLVEQGLDSCKLAKKVRLNNLNFSQ